MESRVNKKLDIYITEFKTNIKEWFVHNNAEATGDSNNSEFLKFIYDYQNLNLSKDDLQKRKRVKNCVPQTNRCLAKRANGEQCTRRKKESNEFCGTHIKGTPHGVADKDMNAVSIEKKKEVWVQEINGINYFIDKDNNVYNPSDVINEKINPTIIAKYQCTEGGYSIVDNVLSM